MATGLCAFTHTALQLAACRILLGLGMGGEWAAGAALVAETWPASHRARALGIVQSAWAVGYALAAGLTALVMPRLARTSDGAQYSSSAWPRPGHHLDQKTRPRT